MRAVSEDVAGGDGALGPRLSVGRAGRLLGVSGGDIRRGGHRRVRAAQVDAWLAEPPEWLTAARAGKRRAARRAAEREVVRVPVSCCVCGAQRLVRPGLVRGFTHLVCGPCDKAGKRPAVTKRRGMVLSVEYNVAGFFVGYTHRIATVAERESTDRAIELARYAATHSPWTAAAATTSPPERVHYVADTKDRVWITKAVLTSRGWTEAAIRDFLPAPEGHKRNPHYATAAPMPVWTPQTVAEAESSPAWKDWLAKSLKRRGLAAPPAAADEWFAAKAARAAAAIAACLERAEKVIAESPEPEPTTVG